MRVTFGSAVLPQSTRGEREQQSSPIHQLLSILHSILCRVAADLLLRELAGARPDTGGRGLVPALAPRPLPAIGPAADRERFCNCPRACSTKNQLPQKFRPES